MKWQPIETAPKDGRALLLCWAIDADNEFINWNREPNTAGVFVQVASYCCDEGYGHKFEPYWSVYCDMIEDPTLHFEPTHWMPLPAPPKE